MSIEGENNLLILISFFIFQIITTITTTTTLSVAIIYIILCIMGAMQMGNFNMGHKYKLWVKEVYTNWRQDEFTFSSLISI